MLRVDCRAFPCIRLYFEWADPDDSNITEIVPEPTEDERLAIDTILFSDEFSIGLSGLFGGGPGPITFPKQVDVRPCMPPCKCKNIKKSDWVKAAKFTPIEIMIYLPDLGKQFTVTLNFPAKVAVGIGQCK